MNELGIPERTRRDEQLVFFNSGQIFGIQNVNINYQTNETYLKYLGSKINITLVPVGPRQGQASFSTLQLTGDQFLPLVRDTGFNGFIFKNPKTHSGNFSFSSGYLVSYSNRCAIGQIPQIDADILIVGNIGKLLQKESLSVSGHIANISGASNTFIPKIPGPGTMEITLDDFNTNRVLAYDLRITCPRLVTYSLGENLPTSVDLNYPLIMDLSFQFEIDNYQAHRLNAFPCSPKIRDLELKIKSFDKNETILIFEMIDVNLISESYSMNIDGNAIINAVYRGYLTRGFEDSWGPTTWSNRTSASSNTSRAFGLIDESGLRFQDQSGLYIITSIQ